MYSHDKDHGRQQVGSLIANKKRDAKAEHDSSIAFTHSTFDKQNGYNHKAKG